MIYTIGGYDGGELTTNEAYDPVSNSWTTKASMTTPTGLEGVAGASVNGVIYVIGGNRTTTNEAYDPISNSWTTKAAMTTGRTFLAAVSAGGVIYAIGGHNGSFLATNEASSVQSVLFVHQKN